MRFVLLAALIGTLASCSTPRANARVRVTPDGVKVAPSLSTSIVGIGVSVTQ